MYVGYDSTTLDAIPRDAQVVFCYRTGDTANEAEARSMFPHAIIQTIDVTGRVAADWLDIEGGDATAGQFPGWVELSRKAGHFRPGAYASLDNMPPVIDAIKPYALARDEYRLGAADWTSVPHIPPGYDACQWMNRALGRNLDEWLILSSAMPPRPALDLDTYRAEITLARRSGHWLIRGVD